MKLTCLMYQWFPGSLFWCRDKYSWSGCCCSWRWILLVDWSSWCNHPCTIYNSKLVWNCKGKCRFSSLSLFVFPCFVRKFNSSLHYITSFSCLLILATYASIYMCVCWFLLHLVSLVGQSAPPEVLQKLTYLVLRHHPQIKRVDTVRAYTFGVLYFVEVSWLISEVFKKNKLRILHCTNSCFPHTKLGWHWTARGFAIERSPCNWRIIADKDWGAPWSWTGVCSSRFWVWTQARALCSSQAPRQPALSFEFPISIMLCFVILAQEITLSWMDVVKTS